MKRLFLILLLLIITLRILQQLYIRANIDQGLRLGILGDSGLQVPSSTENRASDGVCKGNSIVWDSGFTTYNDRSRSESGKNLNLVIGSEIPMTDRRFFIAKRLISSLNSIYCDLLVSIDVWKGVFSGFREVLLNKITLGFNQIYYSSVSDVVTGVTLGIENPHGSQNDHLFKVTGTQHLMAISGFNLTFFVAFVNRLYGTFFSKSTVLILNLLTSCLFIWLIGVSPGILRAFLMFVVTHSAYFFKRQSQVFYSLIITFFFAILIDLSSVFTIGFQLSYAATLGIVLFSNFSFKVKNLVDKLIVGSSGTTTDFLEYLFAGIFTSFAAEVMVFPLLTYYFKEFSLIGAFATVAVSWAMPLILQLGILTTIAQFVLPFNLLFIFSIPLLLVTQLVIFLLQLFYFDNFLLSFPGLDGGFLVIYYLAFSLIYGLIFTLRKNKNRKKYEEIYHFRF